MGLGIFGGFFVGFIDEREAGELMAARFVWPCLLLHGGGTRGAARRWRRWGSI